MCVLASLTMLAQDGLTVENIQNSGCMAEARAEDYVEPIPTIVLTKEGSIISMQLLNYESNCATADFIVKSNISGGNDGMPCSVNVSVTPYLPGDILPTCTCPYNVSFTLRDLVANTFYLNCWWYEGLVSLVEGKPLVLEDIWEETTINDVRYILRKGLDRAMLANGSSCKGEFRIPSELSYEGKTYSVTSIGESAFSNNKNLTKVFIPRTIINMDLSNNIDFYFTPFYGCTALESIEVEEGNPALCSVDGVLFNKENTKLLSYPAAKQRTSYTVPEGVTSLGELAFSYSQHLKTLDLPESVCDLGSNVFSGCNLNTLYIRGIIEIGWMSSNIFSNMGTDTELYVQPSEVEKYKAIYNGPVYSLTEDQDDFAYLPFVKEGKRWNVFRSDFDTGCHLEQYMLGNEGIVKEGKTYTKMTRSEDDLDVIYDTGLFREEDRKVYIFDAESQEEHLMFDYSLKEGDTYETFSYDEQRMVTYKVLSVSDYQEGPEVIRYDYNQEGSLIKHHRYLKKWTVCRTDNESLQKTWIEGVGSLEGPLGNLHDVVLPGMTKDYLGYVEYLDYDFIYLPFSFNDSSWKLAYGCDLPTGEADDLGDDYHHQLTYELVGDRLHVHGKVFTQCGPNNYAYFLRDDDYIYDKSTIRKYHFVIQEAQPTMDCMALHATDFYVSGFDPNLNYIVVDNQGVEHPVINKNIQMAYRPFIEEGKVWKLGGSEFGSGASGNPVWRVEYYYFDGDTIINGKNCKQMMRQRYVSPNHPDYDNFSKLPPLSYVGAWYEEYMKVYFYNAKSNQFSLWYDFSLDAYDTLQIDQTYGPYVLGPRQTGGIKGFKGVYRDVMMCPEGESMYNTTWLEGIGNIDGPIYNVFYESEGHAMFLMSCTVGDEVIYLNDLYEDGATPGCIKDRKRFDFTHTIKTQPKMPRKWMGVRASSPAETEQSLYGEYNNQQLSINLDPLDEAYTVRIIDETGKVVYEKNINAGSIVGLSIDISAFTEGRYTVTVENIHESFTGVFEALTTGISDVVRQNDNGEMINESIYNLQGQRLNSLQKGLNIVNGKKVYVK